MAGMNDEHVDDLMSAYLDGRLSLGELPRVAAHLEDCAPCIAEFRAVQQGRAALRMLPWLAMPDGLDPHAGELLSALLDGECPPVEAAAVRGHLEHCASCRDELHELDAARTAIRSMPTLEYSAAVPLGRRRSRRHRVAAAAAWAAGIAAAVAVSFGMVTADRSTQPVDFDSIASRHSARMSVETGLPLVPVMLPAESSP